jgi:Fe2+ or Zn2+ uptake regulation protein
LNFYHCSDGSRVSKKEIDRRIRDAKKQKILKFIKDHGYVYCEECGRNDCIPVDCSHDISVDECQKSGRAELAWDINNITLRCRNCHKKHDGNIINPT